MTRLTLSLIVFVIAAPAAEYQLKPSPQTLAWGYYWAEAKPVLTIESGDVVEIQTVSGNPTRRAAGRRSRGPHSQHPHGRAIRLEKGLQRNVDAWSKMCHEPVAVEGNNLGLPLRKEIGQKARAPSGVIAKPRARRLAGGPDSA
jgi:hypothetical protein